MASVGPEILSGGSVNYNLDTAFMHFTEQEKNLLYNDIDNVPEYITNNHDSFISWLKNNKEKIKKTITKLTNGKIISCDDFSKLLINLYMLNYHGIEDQNKIEAIIKKSLDFHDADEEQIDVDLIVNDNLKILRESPVENYDFFDELIKKMKEDSPNFSPEEIKNLNKIFNYFRKIAKQKNIKLKDKIIKEFLEEISNYFVKPAIRQAFEQGKLNEMIFEEVYVMTSLISVIGVFNVKDSQLKFIYETEPEELWFEKYIKLTSENPEEIQKLLNDKSSKEKFLKKMYKYKKAKQNIKSFADEHKEKIEIVPSPPDVEIPHNKENLPDSETLENSSDDGISGSLVGDSNEGSDDGKTLENLSEQEVTEAIFRASANYLLVNKLVRDIGSTIKENNDEKNAKINEAFQDLVAKIKKIKDSDFSEEEKETLIKEQIAKTAKVISEIAGKPNLFLRFYYLIIEILTNIRILKPKPLEEHLSKNKEAKEVLVKKIGDAYKKDDVDRTVLGEVAKKPDDMIKFGQSGAQAADFAPSK